MVCHPRHSWNPSPLTFISTFDSASEKHVTIKSFASHSALWWQRNEESSGEGVTWERPQINISKRRLSKINGCTSSPTWICFWFSRDQVGGEVQPFILLNLLLVIFIWGLFYKIKQVHLHLHSWLSIGKTCYNKILCLPFGVVMTEEWSIKWRGKKPGRCFLCGCEVSREWFKGWQRLHIICCQSTGGRDLQRIHSWKHKVQVR